MIADFLALYDFLQKNTQKFLTMGAMFDMEGVRIEGDQLVEVERLSTDLGDNVWYYRVKPVKSYVFVPMPVLPCRVEYAMPDQNPTTELFRFTANNLSATTRPNLLVSFSVIGYQPKQLVDRLKQR
jgi:hypothetical protein